MAFCTHRLHIMHCALAIMCVLWYDTSKTIKRCIMCNSYYQGQKLLDCLSLFSSIYVVYSTKMKFLSIVRWNRNPKLLSQNSPFPPSSQCCVQQWRLCHYSVDQHWKSWAGKSLINMTEWSTFVPDCSYSSLLRSHEQVITFTDSIRWTGV